MTPAARIPVGAAAAAALAATPVAAQEDARWHALRETMVAEQIEARGITDAATLAAMRAVPRHEFVPSARLADAYGDFPLPIGHGATISQPYIVALMTQLAAPRPGLRVLEIGTGSGYQAAVLAAAGCRVWSVEIVSALAQEARERLIRLGYAAIEVRTGDGWLGWPEAAPFDAVLVTAAGDSVPGPLLEQLAPGGRLVMPVSETDSVQVLMVVEKAADGTLTERRIAPVRFVPLQRGRPR
jgi:protein-L-isoaspartate(D-aspartate) O-methyltransferase